MFRRFAFSLIAIATAAALSLPGGPQHVRATETDPLLDSDGDFLPDVVEWAVLSNSSTPDTDGDSIPDFVEVVQRGTPRSPNSPLPIDQEMRVVVTAPPVGQSGPTWLHLLILRAEPTAEMTSFQAWLELPNLLPGVRISFDIFSLGPVSCRQRDAGPDGTWLMLSVPLADMSALAQLLPCSLQAETVLGGRYLRSGVSLLNAQGSIATLTHFRDSSYALQSLAPSLLGSGSSNRVCVLDLTQSGSSTGGTLYTVTGANCEDCNELECVLTSCQQSLGWVVTIPGGLGVLGGTN